MQKLDLSVGTAPEKEKTIIALYLQGEETCPSSIELIRCLQTIVTYFFSSETWRICFEIFTVYVPAPRKYING